MKKLLIPCFVLLSFIGFMIVTSSASAGNYRLVKTIERECGLKLGNCTVVYSNDSHGGFHGDGTTVALLKISEEIGHKAVDALMKENHDYAFLNYFYSNGQKFKQIGNLSIPYPGPHSAFKLVDRSPNKEFNRFFNYTYILVDSLDSEACYALYYVKNDI